MTKKPRLANLDALRGMAIMAVLTIHATSAAVGKLSKDSTLYPIYFILNTISQFAVPAFLFLSALLLFYHYDESSRLNLRDFYRKRMQRILLPYFIWSLFYAMFISIGQGTSFHSSLLRFGKGLLIGTNYAHLYFIVIIVQFYLLFPLFLLLKRVSFVRRHPLLCGAVLQISFYALNYYEWQLHKIGTYLSSYFIYLFLGAYIAGRLKESNQGTKPLSLKKLFIIWLPNAAFYLYETWMLRFSSHWIPRPFNSYVNFIVQYTYISVSCLLLMTIASSLKEQGLINRILLLIGKHSFGIYFIHPFILLLWRKNVMNGVTLHYHLLTFTGGALALGLSLLATKLISSTPLAPHVVGESYIKAPRLPTSMDRSDKQQNLSG